MCNTFFFPSGKELAFARKIVQAFETVQENGKAAVAVNDKMIGPPFAELARRILLSVR